MTHTMTAEREQTNAERTFYFGGAHFNPAYHAQRVEAGMDVAMHREHLGGGWWLLMADEVWVDGINALVIHHDGPEAPSAWLVARIPRIKVDALPGKPVQFMSLDAVPADGYVALGKALTGALGDVLKRVQVADEPHPGHRVGTGLPGDPICACYAAKRVPQA